MAALTYAILAQDVTNWGSLTAIRNILQVSGRKLLYITTDPLIDPTVLAPEEAYEITNL